MSEINSSHEGRLQKLYVYRKETDRNEPEGTSRRIAMRSLTDNGNYVNGLIQENTLLLEQLKGQLKDGLITDVYNRAAFEEFFLKEIAETKRQNNPFMLLFFDLDNFKKINDTLDHLAGDKALKVFGNLLNKKFREEDIISRYGGDEFTVLTKEVKEKDNIKIMEDKCLELEEEYKKSLINIFEGQEKLVDSIGVSFGISLWEKGFDMKKMIGEADLDMYERKNKKKDEQK